MVSKGYSAREIALHWIAFVLVAFQWFAGDDMTRLFRAAHGGRPTDVAFAWTPVHIAVGVAILAVMLWQLVLRRADGGAAADAASGSRMARECAACRALSRSDRGGAGRPTRLFLSAAARGARTT